MSAPENPPFHPLADVGVNGNELSFATSGGLTLRDWFAGQCLAGLCANESYQNASMNIDQRDGRGFGNGLALTAYRIADAMLAERAKGGVS